MRKILQRLQLLLPTIISFIILLGAFYTISRYFYHWFGMKVVASQDVVLRELTTNEIHRNYLFERVDGNHKKFWQLARVIKCESGWDEMAYNYKTHDVGLFQINIYSWDRKAKELGFENYQDYWRDNLDMGLWIFKNSGIQNWVCARSASVAQR